MPFDIRGKIRQVNITGAPYALVKARGDGNCLFHSAGHLLERAGLLLPAHNSHATFRAHVVNYVDQHAKDTNALGFKLRDGLGIARNAQGAVTPAQALQIDQRVAYLRRAGTWGDEACITAVENLYNVEALVYDNAGSLTNNFGLRHYTPHHSPVNKLRLCAQFVGSAPYHYDLYLPNGTYDPAQDGPDQTLAPPPDEAPKPKPEAPPPSDPQGPRNVTPREAPEEQWPYFMDPAGLRPYGPPIVHRQFPYTAAWLDDKGSSGPVKKEVQVSLGGDSNVNVSPGPPAPVVAVQLVNNTKSSALPSTSFNAAQGKEAFATGYREKLFLPLQRQDGICVDILDAADTDLVIDLARGEAPPPGKLHGAFFRRSAGLSAGSSGPAGPVADFELNLSALEGKDVDEGGARTRYTIPAATVLDKRLAKFLGWEGAPYQLVVSNDIGLPVAASAWTYFHVPNEWDVNTAEALGGAPVLMLQEDLQPLAAAGIGAQVQAVANTSIGREAPNGREAFALPNANVDQLTALMAAAGKGIDWNTNNYLVERDEGYYVATSWASMVHLRRNAEEECYYMDALYCYGAGRKVYSATLENVRRTGERREAGAEIARHRDGLVQGRMRLGGYADAVINLRAGTAAAYEPAQAYLLKKQEIQGGMLFRGEISLRMKPDDINRTVTARMREEFPDLVVQAEKAEQDRSAKQRELTPVCERRCGEVNQSLEAMRSNRELLAYLRREQIAFNVPGNVTFTANNLPRTEEEARRAQDQVNVLYTELSNRMERAAANGLELAATRTFEGVKDFDTATERQRLGSDASWKQFIFDPPLPVTHAVTAGISSCAGGVTVTTEDTPEHVWLWHIDGQVPIPLREDLARLWPDAKDVPELRSVAVINPSPWEINKYRPQNLYPAGALGRCQTVYLARSSHFYEQFPVVVGCDFFGVDVSDGRANLSFTYEFEKRTEPLAPSASATEVDWPGLLVDFTDNLYGSYRYQDEAVADPAAMGKYLANATTKKADERAVITRRIRENSCKSCVVAGFNATAFDTLAGQCRPLLDMPCFHAGEKGDREMGHGRTIRWMPGSFES